jgi:hypothetical protein
VHAASFATPDAEIAALRALLSEREAVLAERDAALAEREAALRNAGFEIEKLKVQLAALRRDRYGKSSEKPRGQHRCRHQGQPLFSPSLHLRDGLPHKHHLAAARRADEQRLP